ncbi:hypothetical protein FGB62_290g05 [Gracilaria domingensis]|nr:hypothetical protein FGB62_290g05 [Gracilaria domingensis]
MSAEVSTILAATDAREESYADKNFDPVISVPTGPLRPRVEVRSNTYCDDFFVPIRGVFENGKVLKCVTPRVRSPTEDVFNCIRVVMLYGSGRTMFEMYSQNGSFAAVELSTSVVSKSGETLKTMPFRPDLMSDQERVRLLNGILNRIATKLGHAEVETSRNLWSVQVFKGSGGKLESMDLLHRLDWSDPLESITQAVTSGLRELDLVLNSSGEPWVYTMPYTFERRNALMAITKPYRLCHGWLVLMAFLLTGIHIAVNSWVTHFDDVAYVAMKELLGEDCILGPLVEVEVHSKDVDLVD